MAYIDTVGHIARMNAKDIGDLESLDDISLKRTTKEYKAKNTGRVIISAGNITVDPISVGVLYDPDDSAGIGELENAFLTNTAGIFEIELSDKPVGGTSGTKYTWDKTLITEFKIAQEEDGKALATFTATVNGSPVVTAAA